jgi:hypothetical protein
MELSNEIKELKQERNYLKELLRRESKRPENFDVALIEELTNAIDQIELTIDQLEA